MEHGEVSLCSHRPRTRVIQELPLIFIIRVRLAEPAMVFVEARESTQSSMEELVLLFKQ